MTRIFAVFAAAALAVACSAVTAPSDPAGSVAVVTTAATQPATTTTSSTSTSTTPTTTSAGYCPTFDGVNDAGACNADSQTYCSGFYSDDWESYARQYGYTTSSWKYGLIDCLGKHTVSASCKASLDRREVLNAAMVSACQSYCRGTTPQPGSEPCVDKLKSVYSSLDAVCKAALDAHEAAKAVDGTKCGI